MGLANKTRLIRENETFVPRHGIKAGGIFWLTKLLLDESKFNIKFV